MCLCAYEEKQTGGEDTGFGALDTMEIEMHLVLSVGCGAIDANKGKCRHGC